MNITFKVADKTKPNNPNLTSTWIGGYGDYRAGGCPDLTVTYKVGKIAYGTHSKLPMYALRPDRIDKSLDTGCQYSHVMVVGYQDADVNDNLPWCGGYNDLTPNTATQ